MYHCVYSTLKLVMKASISAVLSFFFFFFGDEITAQDIFPHILEHDRVVEVYYPGCSDDVDSLSYILKHKVTVSNPDFREYTIRQIRTSSYWKFGKPEKIGAKDTVVIEFTSPQYKHYSQIKIMDEVFMIDLEGGLTLTDRYSFITVGYGCIKEELKSEGKNYFQKSQDGLPDLRFHINRINEPVMMGKALDDGTRIGSWMFWDEKGRSSSVMESSIAQLNAFSDRSSITDIKLSAYVEDSLYTPLALNSKDDGPYAYYSFDPNTSRLIAETEDLIGEQLFFQKWREFEMVIMSMGSKGKGYAYDQNQRIFFEDTLSYCIKSNLGLDGRVNVELAVSQELKSMGLESWSTPMMNTAFYYVDMNDFSIEKRQELYQKLSDNIFIEDWGLSFKQPGYENLLLLTRDFYIYTSGDTNPELIDELVRNEERLTMIKTFQPQTTKYIQLRFSGNVNVDYLNFLNNMLKKYDWIQSYQLNFAGYQIFPEAE